MARPRHRLHDLILSFYRAAESPAEWGGCLERVRERFDAVGVIIVHQDHRGRTGGLHAFTGFSPESMRDYHEHYYQLDPWNLALSAADWLPERVFDGRDVVPNDTLRKTEYYAHMGLRHDCAQALFTTLESPATGTVALSINRGVAQPEFTDADRQLLGRLAPHARQALRVHRRLTAADRMGGAAGAALDHLPFGVILLTRGGMPCFVNPAAAAMAQANDGLFIDVDAVRGVSPAASVSLQRAIGQALCLRSGLGSTAPDRTVTLPRASGRRAYTVVVAPAGDAVAGLAGEAAAEVVLFVTDPEAAPRVPADVVARLFGLTPAESRVAIDLAHGLTPDAIASKEHRSVTTIRWHVKQVLHKTRVSTQTQLARLILVTLAAGV